MLLPQFVGLVGIFIRLFLVVVFSSLTDGFALRLYSPLDDKVAGYINRTGKSPGSLHSSGPRKTPMDPATLRAMMEKASKMTKLMGKTPKDAFPSPPLTEDSPIMRSYPTIWKLVPNFDRSRATPTISPAPTPETPQRDCSTYESCKNYLIYYLRTHPALVDKLQPSKNMLEARAMKPVQETRFAGNEIIVRPKLYVKPRPPFSVSHTIFAP